MNECSTREAARKLGLSLSTLNKYIALELIPLPPLITVGTVRIRLWNEKDIERVREILPRIANGRKKRHQRKKNGTKTKKK